MNLETIGATSLDNLDRLPLPTQLRVVREIAKRIGIVIPPHIQWTATNECRVGYIKALIGTVRLKQAMAGYHFDA